jgi:hypothetical protein
MAMPSIPRGDQSATVNFPIQRKFVKKPASQQAAIRCTPYLAKKSAHMLMMLLPGGGEIGTAICVEDGSYCAGDGNDSREEQERGRWKRIREGNEGAGSGEAEAEDRKRGMGEEKRARERRGSCDDSLVCLNTAMKEVRQRGREPRPECCGDRFPLARFTAAYGNPVTNVPFKFRCGSKSRTGRTGGCRQSRAGPGRVHGSPLPTFFKFS